MYKQIKKWVKKCYKGGAETDKRFGAIRVFYMPKHSMSNGYDTYELDLFKLEYNGARVGEFGVYSSAVKFGDSEDYEFWNATFVTEMLMDHIEDAHIYAIKSTKSLRDADKKNVKLANAHIKKLKKWKKRAK